MALTALTVVVALLSQLLVDAIEIASRELKIPPMFVAAIILPIAGNATEHAGAVIFAYKNRVSISLGIALGSVVQVLGHLPVISNLLH